MHAINGRPHTTASAFVVPRPRRDPRPAQEITTVTGVCIADSNRRPHEWRRHKGWRQGMHASKSDGKRSILEHAEIVVALANGAEAFSG